MRVIATANTPLERKTWESVKIYRIAAENPDSCLNLKTEWGLSKNPSLVQKGRPKAQEMAIDQGKRSKWEGREKLTLAEPLGKRQRTASPVRMGHQKEETGSRETELETGANTIDSV